MIRVLCCVVQVVPYGQGLKKGKGKKKRCHWCQKSDSGNLIKCSSCHKEFFCMDCIKERFVIVEFIYSTPILSMRPKLSDLIYVYLI